MMIAIFIIAHSLLLVKDYFEFWEVAKVRKILCRKRGSFSIWTLKPLQGEERYGWRVPKESMTAIVYHYF
jgi:hypothetical protein